MKKGVVLCCFFIQQFYLVFLQEILECSNSEYGCKKNLDYTKYVDTQIQILMDTEIRKLQKQMIENQKANELLKSELLQYHQRLDGLKESNTIMKRRLDLQEGQIQNLTGQLEEQQLHSGKFDIVQDKIR